MVVSRAITYRSMKRSNKNRLSIVLFASCIFVFLFEISHRNPPQKSFSGKQSYLGAHERALDVHGNSLDVHEHTIFSPSI